MKLSLNVIGTRKKFRYSALAVSAVAGQASWAEILHAARIACDAELPPLTTA